MKRNEFIKILRILEGIKSALKVAHWNETQSMNRHEQLDKISETINEFQDSFAEDGFSVFGIISPEEFVAEEVMFETTQDLVKKIHSKALKINHILSKESSPEFVGMKSLADNLVHDMKIYMYRIGMQ